MPPQTLPSWVDRKPLLLRIDKALAKKLALLTAPVGSGKTTLLIQWYRHAAATRAIGWLSLDAQDNEPVRFFSYLIGAVRGTVANFDAYIASRLHDQVDPPLDHVATIFVESLDKIEHELVIVLDDFQYISDPAITRALLFMLNRSPPHVHWIISSRGSPELNLSQMKLRDELALIDAAELSFDGALIAQLSRKLGGADLSTEDADYISVRTEGWAAGAKLALLSTSDSSRAGEPLKQFTGSHSEIVHYLANTVLRDQPPDVRDFLVASATVDKLNGDLCNALLGISSGQEILEYLERAQLFIRPLDNHRQWYRYHSLFLDFLRDCLQRESAPRIPQLHQAASQWYAEHQMNEDALRHAVAAGDRAWIMPLAARCLRAWFNDGEIAEVLRWAEKLPTREPLGHPDVCVPYIAALILSRRFDQAATLLREMEKRMAESNRPSAISLKVLNLMLATLSDATNEIPPIDDELVRRTNDASLTGILMAVQAYRLLYRQKFDAARRLAMRARDLVRDAHSVFLLGYADVVVCLADRAQGNFKAAAENCEQSYARVKSGRRNSAWVNAATALANSRYEQNRLAEAEALCVEVLPLLSVASTVENFTTAYITFTRLKSINARYPEAFQLLDYLHSVLENGSQQRFLAQLCYEKVRLCLMQGQTERAGVIAGDFGIPGMFNRGDWRRPRAYDETWEHLGFTQATLLLHEQRHEECQELLEVLRDSAHAVGFVYREVYIQAALAACHWRAGRHDAAYAALNRGLVLAPRPGFTRGTYDEVPSLPEVIAAAIKAGKLSRSFPVRHFKKFQDIFSGGRDGTPSPEIKRKLALPLEPLTDRELDMLRLLARGLSNQEISEQSRVALSTTKWHLKNIFAKLDVGTRTSAIIRARELQLIDDA